MPQDLEPLLASFLPASSAAAVFISANHEVSSSVQPALRGFSAQIIRYIETLQPPAAGSAGEYHLMDLGGQKLVLVSSLLNPSQPVSLLFPTETSFDVILNAFSALEKLLNASELPDLHDLKARKNSSAHPQRWQDALFDPAPQSPAEAGLPTRAENKPNAAPLPVSDGWTLIL